MSEAEALLSIRSGLLWMMIGGVLAGIGFIVAFLGTGLALFSASSLYALGSAVLGVVAGLAVSLVGIALWLLGLYGKVRGGFRALAEIDNRFSLSYKGTTLMLIGLIGSVAAVIILIASLSLLFLPGAASILAGAPMAIFAVELLLLAFGIVSFIGWIFTFIIGPFKMHERYGESTYRTIAILFIVGIFLSIVALVAMILLYIALGITADVLRRRQQPPALAPR